MTIFPDACNGQRKHSYVVESFLSLPTSFSGDSTPHVNANSSLQLHVSDDGTVASILMVYSNFTIVLRKVDFMLSVTLQVPGSASYFSEGLCSGCPRQQVAGKSITIASGSGYIIVIYLGGLWRAFDPSLKDICPPPSP